MPRVATASCSPSQAQGCELNLTPHQARVLATELIMAVNRAEVRNNLKHSQNMVRGGAAGKLPDAACSSWLAPNQFQGGRLRPHPGSRQPG